MRKFINYQLTFSLLFLTVPILGLDNLKIEQPQVEAFQEELSHLSTEIDRENRLANIYHSIGEDYKEKEKDYKKALSFFYRALESVNKDGSKQTKLIIELAIGNTYLELKEYRKAIDWCKKDSSKLDRSLKLSKNACRCIAIAYDKMGDAQTALRYYKKLTVLTDSMHVEQLALQVDNFENQKKYEKELVEINHKQAVEKEQNKTRTALVLGGILLFFTPIILYLCIINVRRAEQKNQLIALVNLRKELMANVSHDLRTPIAIMQGYVETLLMNLNSTTAVNREKYLNIIMNSSERLSLLITQLFEFSKLETHHIELQKEPFKINELLQSSLDEYKVLADKKGVQLKMDCPEDAPIVYADISLIERVIQNLMDNALKFTPEQGMIKVLVTGQKNNVEISIIDSGCGIAEAQQSKIFNRYEKTKNSKGRGLGLSIVKRILELHEEAIFVKSELGQGTRFIFSLPAYSA